MKKSKAQYVDGFVIAVPKKNLARYRRIALHASKIWKEYGAIDYFECVGDDLNVKFGMPFPKLAKTKSNETVVFSWITYRSKAHRNRVNAQVMKDERISSMCSEEDMPFNPKRMAYGGFKVFVSA